MFLPIDKKELKNNELDFVLISCDAYVDHPTFGHAVISRIIYDKGFSIGIIPQPLCDQDYYALPTPKYAYLISSGVVDSMVNNYTVAKKKRTGDVYSPLSKQNKRPDRQVTVYAKTLKRHLDKLIEKGLVVEEELVINGEKYPSYVFPYNYDKKYQLIEKDMLWYIISTRNRQAVKIYTQLLNWYLWKKESDEFFIFTNKDIMKILGYSTDNKMASSMVSNILESLSREGVIRYENYFEDCIANNGVIVPTPKKKLIFVAKSKSELPAASR
jgi:hypothetical protein